MWHALLLNNNAFFYNSNKDFLNVEVLVGHSFKAAIEVTAIDMWSSVAHKATTEAPKTCIWSIMLDQLK